MTPAPIRSDIALHPADADPAAGTTDPDLRDLATVRVPGHPVARVLPADGAGDGTARALVVVEDMPHLIDTQIAELRRRRLTPLHVVHPRVRARRDPDGRLRTDAADEPGTVEVAESWTAIEVAGLPAGGEAGLADALARRVGELRAHLDTEPGLADRVRALADELTDGAGSPEAAEFPALLRWCADGHLHLLGLDPLPDGEAVPEAGHVGWSPQRSRVLRDERPVRIVVPPTRPGAPAHVLTGLFSVRAGRADVASIPVIGRRFAAAAESLDLSPQHWFGRRALELLQEYPRNCLLRTDTRSLIDVLSAVPEITDQRQVRTVVDVDAATGVTSVLAFLPRERCTADVRVTLRGMLQARTGGLAVEQHVSATPSGTMVVHLTVDGDPAGLAGQESTLDAELLRVLDTWDDRLATLAGPDAAGWEFPDGYRAEVTPDEAARDLARLDALDAGGGTAVALHPDDRAGGAEPAWRFVLYSRDGRVALSAVLPVLHSLGLHVIGEQSWRVARDDGARFRVHRFDVRSPAGPGDAAFADRLADAFDACWSGRADVDGFNALVGRAALTWRQCLLLRAVARYLRQIGRPYGTEHVAETLAAHPAVASALVALFEARFDATVPASAREVTEQRLRAGLDVHLDAVTSREADRVLRGLRDVVLAVLRTNHGGGGPDLALKIDPAAVPGMPEPRPAIEAFVFSADLEGVHLRFDRVARGGLRWSDRAEDYRTEVLGLCKAQALKNAVVVPAGAKGGFVSRTTPGDGHYRRFVTALLDLVDDRAPDGSVVPLLPGVRHDGDDDYLVVAADKGTARFSDVANAVALERGYWLGDAFASGGRTGYDHKKMGITARGAWRSVRRHLHERGIAPDRDPVTVAGVGDMSGDVFGNGLLASTTLRLVAAFDHRHVFLDPDPDAARGYAERRRLFDLPGSSWDDYDRDAISPGGGVWPRTAKSVPVGPQVRRALGLDAGVSALDPPALIRAILRAPVDLLWNGGVGTYVKASHETHADVGDRADDDLRVDAIALRAAVVGEGGNLGLTPAARIEFARRGGSVNTDAIDNSAGVSCSDHEVNIKIVLDALVRDGRVAPAERDELLAGMTGDVAALVLAENDRHNEVVGVARAQAAPRLGTHAALIAYLEQRHGLDRELDALPGPEEIEARRRAGEGLSSPELCTLLGRTKLALAAEIAASTLPDDESLVALLPAYFPAALTDLDPAALRDHPLRRQIVVSVMTNHVVDHAGISFCHRLAGDTGATWADTVRAYLVASAVLGGDALHERLAGAVATVDAATGDELVLLVRRLLDRGARWMLLRRPHALELGPGAERLRRAVSRLAPRIGRHVRGEEAGRLAGHVARLTGAGVGEDTARRCVEATYTVSLLDIADVGDELGDQASPDELADLYFELADRLELHRLLDRIGALPRSSRAETLSRAFLRDQTYGTLRALTRHVAGDHREPAVHERLDRWERQHAADLQQIRSVWRHLDEDPSAAPLAAATAAVQQLGRLPR